MESRSKPGPHPLPTYQGPWSFPAPALEGWGKALAEWRRAVGCTQSALADYLGVKILALRRWETGAQFPNPASRALLKTKRSEKK